MCPAGRGHARAPPHPPGRPGFGRRSLAIEPAVLGQALTEQCAALAAITRAHGRTVEYVKPHGALYHDANASAALATAVVTAAADILGDRVVVIGPPAGA